MTRSSIANAIREALARRREAKLEACGCVRLLDASGDGVAGLVVETFGSVVRLETSSTPTPTFDLHAAACQLVEGWPRLTTAVHLERQGQGAANFETLLGDPPAGVVLQESSDKFFAKPCQAEAAGAGIFADQRLGRAFVRAHARGRPVLNLFAHAGAFGVAAAGAGASQVDHVDAARKCARWAALNLALNGHFPRRHRFIVDDALQFLDRAARKGPSYGVIICDPPTWARRKNGQRLVTRDALDYFAKQTLSVLLPGGALILSCNDRRLQATHFLRALEQQARALGRQFDLLQPLSMGPDFTASAAAEQSTRGALAILSAA